MFLSSPLFNLHYTEARHTRRQVLLHIKKSHSYSECTMPKPDSILRMYMYIRNCMLVKLPEWLVLDLTLFRQLEVYMYVYTQMKKHVRYFQSDIWSCLTYSNYAKYALISQSAC